MEKKPHLCKVFKCTKINKTAAKPIINALLKFIKMRTKYFKYQNILWRWANLQPPFRYWSYNFTKLKAIKTIIENRKVKIK